MYYEITEEQIDWTHWKDRRTTVCGDWCWRAGGVSLYQPTRKKLNRTIVPHRFAINPRKELRRDIIYMYIRQKLALKGEH